jgi:hypothetical protein
MGRGYPVSITAAAALAAALLAHSTGPVLSSIEAACASGGPGPLYLRVMDQGPEPSAPRDATPAEDLPRFSLRRLRAALAKHRAAEEAMADAASQSGAAGHVGTQHWQLPDGTWVHGRPPSGRG